MPRVSVVMPVYNAERFVREAVDSILAQTFTDFEFIIINDGSTDNTTEIIKSYDDERIILIDQERKGLVYTLNHGIQKARAPYIARMDGDDIALPERLSIQLSIMKRYDSIGALGTGCQLIDSKGYPIGRKINKAGEHFEILENILNATKGTSIIHPTSMIRTDTLLSVGGYNDRFPVCEDVDLWLRIANISRLHVLQDILLLLRIHQQNVSVAKRHIQLQSGILTRVCFLLRNSGLPDPSLFQEDAWRTFKEFVNNTIESYNLYRVDQARSLISTQLARHKGLNKYLRLLYFLILRPTLIEGLTAKRKWNHVITKIVDDNLLK